MGFTYSSWALFRYPDGTPRTPRDANGRVPVTEGYTCVDGSTHSVRVPSSNTLVASTERGVAVNRLVTPKVAAVARDIFGCDRLDGAELENQPTTAGTCFASHWEQLHYAHEAMTSSRSSHRVVYSALTLGECHAIPTRASLTAAC